MQEKLHDRVVVRSSQFGGTRGGHQTVERKDGGVSPSLLLAEQLEGAHEVLVDHHDRSCIALTAAIVGCREDGDQSSVELEQVPVHALVGPADEVEVESVHELVHDVLSEEVGDLTRGRYPTSDVVRRVGPEKVRHEAVLWNDAGALDGGDGREGRELRGQTAVHATTGMESRGKRIQDLVAHDGSEREAVEEALEGVVQLQTVAGGALLAEASGVVHVAGLVVASQEEHVVGIENLVAHQEADDLDATVAAVDVVSEEQIVVVHWVSANVQQSRW